MVVEVQLHTILQRQTPQGNLRRLDVHLPQGCAIQDLLDELEIELAPDALLLVVNGRMVEVDYILSDGDRVNLMPALSGGAI